MGKAAVILAGGRCERFQRRGEPWVDKALTVLNGRTILEGMVVQLRGCVDEIVISVSQEQDKRRYMKALPSDIVADTRIFVDEASSGGPLTGIATTVKHLDAKQFLLLPCDIPFLSPAVVRALFQRIGRNDAAVPTWPNGVLEPLVAVYRTSRVRSCFPLLSSAGRKRPDDLVRGSSRVKFISIENELNAFDPGYRSFVNINYREDVDRRSRIPLPTGSLRKSFTASISLVQNRDLVAVWKAIQALGRHQEDRWRIAKPVMDCLQERRGFFWLALLAEQTAKSPPAENCSQLEDREKLFEAAARAYQSEGLLHLDHGLLALRAHTLLDEAWCWRKARSHDRARSALRAAASIYAELGLDSRKSRTISDQGPRDTSR